MSKRVLGHTDSMILDSMGDPMRRFGIDTGSMGTFSNAAPDPLNYLAALVDAERRAAELVAAARPERFNFGEVSVAGFWVSIQKIEFNSHDGGYGKLVITSHVPDRDSGKPLSISSTKLVAVSEWCAGNAARVAIIRAAIREWLIHEIDEHIFVDGKRADDPHVRPTFPPPLLPEPPADDGLKYFA